MGAVRLRNTGEAVHLYAPPDSPTSLHVDNAQVVTVAGPMEETDDAYICGEGDDARAFPKSRWEVDVPARSTKKTAASAADEKGGEG